MIDNDYKTIQLSEEEVHIVKTLLLNQANWLESQYDRYNDTDSLEWISRGSKQFRDLAERISNE